MSYTTWVLANTIRDRSTPLTVGCLHVHALAELLLPRMLDVPLQSGTSQQEAMHFPILLHAFFGHSIVHLFVV